MFRMLVSGRGILLHQPKFLKIPSRVPHSITKGSPALQVCWVSRPQALVPTIHPQKNVDVEQFCSHFFLNKGPVPLWICFNPINVIFSNGMAP